MHICSAEVGCLMTLLYYVGGGQWWCWLHLLLNWPAGKLIPKRILRTETAGGPR